MSRKKAFTLLELVIVLVVLGILIGISFSFYKNAIKKAQSTEAIITAGQIRQAEEFHKIDKGKYVAAESIEEINEELGLEIKSKYYEYRIVDVTEDNFIVIARRIDEEIESGKSSSPSIVIAMDKSGIISGGYRGPIGPGGTSGGSGGGFGGGGIGGGGSGTGGFGTGTSGGGGGGITGGGGGGTGGTGIGSTMGGAPPMLPVIYNAEITDALDKMKDLTTPFVLGDMGTGNTITGDSAAYYYNLIQEKNIKVEYVTLPSTRLGQWEYEKNTISINKDLKTTAGWPPEAISAIIIHEATHADYSYNVDKWVARILSLWEKNADGTPLTEDNLTGYFKVCRSDTECTVERLLYYSITEEFFTNSNEAQIWDQFKSKYAGEPGEGISFMNGKSVRFQQGESAIRTWLRGIPSYSHLPEFYPPPEEN